MKTKQIEHYVSRILKELNQSWSHLLPFSNSNSWCFVLMIAPGAATIRRGKENICKYWPRRWDSLEEDASKDSHFGKGKIANIHWNNFYPYQWKNAGVGLFRNHARLSLSEFFLVIYTHIYSVRCLISLGYSSERVTSYLVSCIPQALKQFCWNSEWLSGISMFCECNSNGIKSFFHKRGSNYYFWLQCISLSILAVPPNVGDKIKKTGQVSWLYDDL